MIMKYLRNILGAVALLGIGFAGGILIGHNTVAAGRVPAAPVTGSENYTLDNCAIVFDESDVQPNASGYAYWFVKQGFAQDGVDLKMSYVDKAQATHPPHSHDNEEIFYVLEGRVIVHLDGKEATLGPHSALYCPKGSLHGIRRADDKPARYLVINNHGISRKQK